MVLRKLSFPSAKLVSVEHDSEWHSAINNKVCKGADLRLMQKLIASSVMI